MTKKESKEDRGGCFAWLIRVKRAVNERWAKSLNAFRRKHSNQVRPEDELNDTGTPDMVISKVPVSRKQSVVVFREQLTDWFVKDDFPVPDMHTKLNTEIVDGTTTIHSVQVAANNDDDSEKEQVRLYMLDVINNAKSVMKTLEDKTSIIQEDMSMTSPIISDIATVVVNDSLTNMVEDTGTKQVVEDTSSLSSGEISVLAEAAVTQSLTSIINEYQNENHSARSRPRTVTEILDHFNIDTNIGLVTDCEDASLPPCSP